MRTKQQPCSTENALRENCETVANDEMLLASLLMLCNNRIEIFKISDESKMPNSKYNLRSSTTRENFCGKKNLKKRANKQPRIYEVEQLIKSRPSRIFPGKLEYLTQWRDYKRRTWNQASDFLGAALQQMMQNCQ